MKACEEETSKLGQDYYTALAANSPGAAAKRPPSALTGPALTKSKAGTDIPAAATEVYILVTVPTSYVHTDMTRTECKALFGSDTQICHKLSQSWLRALHIGGSAITYNTAATYPSFEGKHLLPSTAPSGWQCE